MAKKNLTNSSFFAQNIKGPGILTELGTLKPLVNSFEIPLELLTPHPNQIRQDYNEELLEELAEDIKQRGVLEPLVVRPIGDNEYEIIAGQRRFMASKLAGLKQVPVVVKEMDDREARFTMLAENIQRQDLTPVEEQQFYLYLIEVYNFSYGEIAELVHKSKSYVTRRVTGDLVAIQQQRSNSEKDNNVSESERSLNNSQSGMGQQVESDNEQKDKDKKSKSFIYTPQVYKKLTKTLTNTLEYVRQPVDAKVKAQLREDLAALKNTLAQIEAQLED